MSNVKSTPTAPVANGAGVVQTTSIEERADALFGTSAPADEAPAESSTATPSASPAGSGTPDEAAAAQARAERRAALAKVQAAERERVDAMTAIRERDQLRKENEELKSRTKAYETYIDPTKLTKEQFFGLAEKNPELTPHELGEWLRERIANPEAAAASAARKAVDPEIAALKRQNEELVAKLNGFLEQQTERATQAEEAEAEAAFSSFAKEQAAAAPYTMKFIAKYGETEFLKIARRAAQSVPEHAGPQAVLDEVEETIERFIKPWTTTENQQRPASVPSGVVPVAQGGISNTLAQQRSSVVDENAEFSKLSLEERAARVFG